VMETTASDPDAAQWGRDDDCGRVMQQEDAELQPSVAIRRTVVGGGGDDAAVTMSGGDDEGVLSSALFCRGNGDIDIDYCLAVVSLDAPFIWGGVTSALCARGRPGPDHRQITGR
jgi:hypothetical protein